MRRILPTLLRRFVRLPTIGQVALALALLAAPTIGLAAQPQPTPADQPAVQGPIQTQDEGSAAPREQAQPAQVQRSQDQGAQEQRTLDQQPTLTDDVRLRAEVYTGNDYSK